jgi:uncharacterized protein YkwD
MVASRTAVLGALGVLAASVVAVVPAQAAPVPIPSGSLSTTGLAARTAGATAVARTVVSGWPSALSSAPAARVAVPVRVSTGSGAGIRTVVVQRYRAATKTWVQVLSTRTGTGGRAVLRWTAPASAGTAAYRVRVVPLTRAAGAVTPAASLRVVVPPMDAVLVDLVKAVNAARSKARTCGTTRYAAVPPVVANPTLTAVAEAYAQRLGEDRFFDHTSPSGDGPGERMTAAGYRWRTFGENLAAGYRSVSDAMAGWLSSPGHCRNIMGAGFTEIGPGYANVSGSPYGTYWVTVFGRR